MLSRSTSTPTSPLREILERARADVRRTPARVAAWYGAFGVAWIIAGDLTVSALFGASADAAVAQTGKGLAFIGLSGALMYAVTARAQRKLSRTLQRAEQAEGLFLEAQRTEALAASVAEIVHDFRNNLAVVSGFSELAGKRLDADDQVGEYVGHIQQAARSAYTLSAQLLELAGGGTADGDPAVELADANTAVTRIGNVLGHLCGRDITVDVSAEARACPVPLSALAIEQVLMNLAINARDAMPGGGRLTISASREASHAGDEIAVITVTDTGTGIDDETLERIFNPYFTTKPPGKGTGLGLPAVRVIVEQAGGSIAVTSYVGRGSTFRIELPAPVAADPAASEGGPPERARTSVPPHGASRDSRSRTAAL